VSSTPHARLTSATTALRHPSLPFTARRRHGRTRRSDERAEWRAEVSALRAATQTLHLGSCPAGGASAVDVLAAVIADQRAQGHRKRAPRQPVNPPPQRLSPQLAGNPDENAATSSGIVVTPFDARDRRVAASRAHRLHFECAAGRDRERRSFMSRAMPRRAGTCHDHPRLVERCSRRSSDVRPPSGRQR